MSEENGLLTSAFEVRIRTVNVHFRGENMSPVTRKIREDGIVASSPVYSKSVSETIQSDR